MSRNVVVTGAAGGIGTAIISRFAAEGNHVVALDILPGPEINGVSWVCSDLSALTCDESSRALADALLVPLAGKCDILINNAAVQRVAPFLQLGADAWAQTMATNVLAPAALTRMLLPLMPAGKGVVLNISSIHACLTKPNFTAYATSKAALSSLTRALAVELGSQARFVAIEPAAISTSMLAAGFEGHPESFAQLESMHPARRVGTPEEVANLAFMLCEPGIDFVNGAVIGIDGGIRARLHDAD